MESQPSSTNTPFIGRGNVSSHAPGTQFQDGYSKGLILFANTITTGIADKFFLKLWGQLGVVLILFLLSFVHSSMGYLLTSWSVVCSIALIIAILTNSPSYFYPATIPWAPSSIYSKMFASFMIVVYVVLFGLVVYHFVKKDKDDNEQSTG